MFQKLKSKCAAFGASLAVLSGSAMAEVPESVTDALADGLTDVKVVAAAGLIIVIAVAIFRHMRAAK